MPTVINNVRSTTPDRLSSCSDTRRVRVSGTSTNWQHTGKKVLFKELKMVKKCFFFVFVCSLMEQKVSPAYTPATLRLRKEPPAITRITQAPRPSLSPGRPGHPVLTSSSGFTVMLDIVKQLLTSHAKTTNVLEAALAFVMLIN